VSAGGIAALIAAGALVLLVIFLAVPLLKLGKTLDEATLTIRQTRESTTPILVSAQDTVKAVNAQLDDLEGVTKGVSSITTNAAALTSIASSTVGTPLIKVAAFSYGVRRTMSQRRTAEAERAARQRHRASRKGS
jgi:uncharacterized protein YoxC